MQVFDVVLARHAHDVAASIPDDLRIYRDQRVNIASNTWVGRLEHEHARCIMDACEPRAFPEQATRQFGYYYAIVRESPPSHENLYFDPDQRLRRVIALSRLIHPTPLGYAYSARVWCKDDGTLDEIRPLYYASPAYGGDLKRPWLTPDEWQDVGNVLAKFEMRREKLSHRVRRALWYHEKTAMEYYFEVRWVQIVTAIESLVGKWTTERDAKRSESCGKRFQRGLVRLGSAVDLPISPADAGEAWKRRSSVVHGNDLPPGALKEGEPSDDLYGRVAEVLGRGICFAIRDDMFAATFETNENLQKWLDTDSSI